MEQFAPYSYELWKITDVFNQYLALLRIAEYRPDAERARDCIYSALMARPLREKRDFWKTLEGSARTTFLHTFLETAEKETKG